MSSRSQACSQADTCSSFWWWKTALSLTRPSPFSHTEQFKRFDLAVSLRITSCFSLPASVNKVITQLKPDGNIISIDQLIALAAANMRRDSQCYYYPS